MLPKLNFQLPEWKESDFVAVKEASDKLRRLAGDAGKASPRFLKAQEYLKQRFSQGGSDLALTGITDALHARAFVHLIDNDERFSVPGIVNERLLERIESVRNPISSLTLIQLIRVFFMRFDTVSEAAGLDTWCQFLQRSLSRYRNAKGGGVLQNLAFLAHELFRANGPERVVNQAYAQQIDFDGLVHRFGLQEYSGGVYLHRCRNLYYIQTLKALEPGASDPVLAELCKPSVYGAKFSDGRFLGHEILEILIDRSPQSGITEAWQQVILTIAGDPRVPKTSIKYQRWWSSIGDARIAKVRGWLSRLDLKVFLEVLEQAAKDGAESDMERMYKPRKAFMEGLLDQDLVSDSRLFLGANAHSYITKNYQPEDLPAYAKVNSPKTSMIYLNIAGKVHMVEGSHSFKIKLLDRLPERQKVTSYDKKIFSDGYFRSELMFDYLREFGHSNEALEMAHDVHFNWQKRAFAYFVYRGVKVDSLKMIHSDQRRAFKKKVGVI